jgi:ABC-type uncharacterized transport system permease subunit
MRLPVNIVIIIQALILFFVLGGDILSRYRLVYSGWSPGKGTSAAAAG